MTIMIGAGDWVRVTRSGNDPSGRRTHSLRIDGVWLVAGVLGDQLELTWGGATGHAPVGCCERLGGPPGTPETDIAILDAWASAGGGTRYWGMRTYVAGLVTCRLVDDWDRAAGEQQACEFGSVDVEPGRVFSNARKLAAEAIQAGLAELDASDERGDCGASTDWFRQERGASR